MIEGVIRAGLEILTRTCGPEDIRLMCSWDTTEEDVDAFAADVKRLAAKR